MLSPNSQFPESQNSPLLFFSMPSYLIQAKGIGSVCPALSGLHVTVKYVPNSCLPVALVLKHKWPFVFEFSRVDTF